MPVRCTRIRPFGICILFILLCLLRSSTLSLLDVLKSFMDDIKRVTRDVDIQMLVDQS